MKITATYSPEDNKIRLYPSSRLDQETYERVKAAGFSWAPKQELFVAPKWSPSREDLAIELAGEIEPEQMTLAERAQMKAERLDNLASKKLAESNAFQRAAQELSERFAGGQPILIGHHSERKARKDKERMQGAQEKAIKAYKAADYWLYRAGGVEAHANYKNDPRVRASRIKTLLAELRDMQRDVNNANVALKFWEKFTSDDHIKMALGRLPNDRTCATYETYSAVDKGDMTPEAARLDCISRATLIANGPRLRRYIEHTLNRLSYERELLGPVRRYQGKLTGTILQMFAREHGAHKPEGKDIDGETFTLESPVPLPLHLGDGNFLEMSGEEWRDLMQSVGYEVKERAPENALPPILNFRAPAGVLVSPHRFHRGQTETYRQVELTKAQYSAVNAENRWTRPSLCGGFRFKLCPDPTWTGAGYMRPFVAVFLTDSKAHPVPESISAVSERAEA